MKKKNNLINFHNIVTDLKIFYFELKQKIDLLFYISSVQAKTFSIIKHLNMSMNGFRRYPINKIVDEIMILQELLLDDNNLDYYKIKKIKITANYIINKNELICNGLNMSRTNQESIKIIINEIVNNLSVDNYLTEDEVKKIILTYRISVKYKKDK